MASNIWVFAQGDEGAPTSATLELRWPDGRSRWVECQATPGTDQGAAAAVVTFREVDPPGPADAAAVGPARRARAHLDLGAGLRPHGAAAAARHAGVALVLAQAVACRWLHQSPKAAQALR